MKKSFLLLICWLLTSNVTLGQSSRNSSSNELEEMEYADVAGLFEYLNQMRIDPKTGEIDVRDVLRARQTANHLAEENGHQKKVGIEWESMGPTNVGGRTRAILVDKDNSQKVFAGSVSGGLFISNNGGETWTDHPQNQDFNTLSVSAITQASNGDIYFGTGERIESGLDYGESKSGASIVPGGGVYKSIDGGVTFQLLEATVPSYTNSSPANSRWGMIQDIEVSPIYVNRIYAATNRGLQISQDGGQTWSNAIGAPTPSVAYDIAIGGDGKAHLVAGSRYYQAVDGLNFDGSFTGDLPEQFEVSSRNKVIAISPTDDDYLYIATTTAPGCLEKVWQSKNGGETWNIIGVGTTESNYEGDAPRLDPMSNGSFCVGYYSMGLTVDPTDKERIYLGSATLWSWSFEDGWSHLEGGNAPYYIGQNKHTLVFDPNNPQKLYMGSDSGLSRSIDMNESSPTFQYINNGYKTAQLYGVAANLEADLIIGGTQGGGTVFFEPNGISDFTNQAYITGSVGGFCETSKLNPLVFFVAGANGRLRRTASANPPMITFFDSNTDCSPDISGWCNPDGRLDGNPLYITPFVLWEDLADNVINGTQRAKLITGACDGRVWMAEGVLDFTAVPSWREIGKFAGSRCISALAFSDDGQMVYAGTTDGRILSMDLSLASPMTTETVIAPGQYITDIDVGFNPSNIVVSLGNYGQNQNVLKSSNADSVAPVYQSFQYNLPLMPVYSIVIDRYNTTDIIEGTENIIVGTELGIWQYDASTNIWTEQNEGIGRVPVHSLQFETFDVFGCEILYAATHGRGVYRTTDFTLPTCDTSTGVAIDETEMSISSLQLFPNPMEESSRLEFSLTKATNLTLKVYDYQGKVVRSQSLGNRAIGVHSLPLEREGLAGGMYLVSLEGEGQRVSRKLVVH